GDINNDAVVDVADRSIVNAFWQVGYAGSYSFQDCDINRDGVVDVADRSITNAIWVGTLGRNSTEAPCQLRYRQLR
ncbi:MAG: dockerin type I domain-containing protein, partial [Phycisphaerae bacterium]